MRKRERTEKQIASRDAKRRKIIAAAVQNKTTVKKHHKSVPLTSNHTSHALTSNHTSHSYKRLLRLMTRSLCTQAKSKEGDEEAANSAPEAGEEGEEGEGEEGVVSGWSYTIVYVYLFVE